MTCLVNVVQIGLFGKTYLPYVPVTSYAWVLKVTQLCTQHVPGTYGLVIRELLKMTPEDVYCMLGHSANRSLYVKFIDVFIQLRDA